MRGLFVHDHRFPKSENSYLYSYGFDEEFFMRYKSIFSSLSIIGRDKEIINDKQMGVNTVDSDVNFLTINNLRQLKNKNTRNKIKNEVLASDYIVVRLPSILGLYAVGLAKKYKKPCLIEVVGCAWDAIANKGMLHIPAALLVMTMMKKQIFSAKYVVYVTEEFLQRRYPTKGKTIACSNVTLDKVSQNDLIERIKKIKKINLTDKVVLGTCATIDVVYKGQEDVIKAISVLKREGYNIEYQLVGGGSKEYLEDVAKKHGVFEHIKFIGPLEHKDVFKWLDKIDVYVHPSKQEGLSRAIIEAMSKGCPIFGADAGGIHEQIDEQFIFEKGNINQICNIYKEFNLDNLIKQSSRNHEKSKGYLKEILYKRRQDFFQKFIEDK